MASYEDINYAIRPAKHIERKMMVEALQRLRVFAPLRRYRYVGFGSTYFADFSLFHRALGIQTMISIEKDESKRERFLFNRPYRTVQIIFGHSNEVLPALKWTKRSIVWLDYDGPLTSSVLADIDWVAGAAPPGSVLVVSVNAHPAPFKPGGEGTRLQALIENVGVKNVPNGVTDDGHLAGWKLADVTRTIIDGAIRQAVLDRAPAGSEVTYRQLFNFQYQDGAKMTTVGGLLLRTADEPLLERCSFDDLPFVSTDTSPRRIRVPQLTNREVRLLDRHMPSTPRGSGVSIVPKRDLDAYAEAYRFFPTFVDVEF